MSRTWFSSWKQWLSFSPLALAVLSPAMAARAAEAQAPVTQEVLAADSTAMTLLFQEKMRALPADQAKPYMQLNLADPAQYAFVLHRLQAAGNTPENAPNLYASLEAARALAQEGREPSEAQRNCLNFITLEDQPLPGTVEYKSSAQVSCFGNNGYLYSDLASFQADAGHHNLSVLDRRVSEEYGTLVGASERASLTFTYRYTPDQLLQLDSLVLAFEQDTGAALAAYSTAATSGFPETGPSRSYTAVSPALTIYHPADLINGTVNGAVEYTHRVCLNRGLIQAGNIDCDYASVVNTGTGYAMYPLNGDYANSPKPAGLAAVNAATSASYGTWVSSASVFQPNAGPAAYDTTRTYIPLQIAYNAGATTDGPCTVTSYDAAYTQALLTMVQADSPRCGVAPGTVLGASSLTGYLVTGSQSASFAKLIDFGAICVDYEKTVKLTVQIGAKATCGVSTNLLRYKTMTVQPIQYRNSCFARGTRILRADGTLDAIENIQMGDKVTANRQGLALTVTGISRGVERSAMVRIKDDQGHEALVTQTHPVVTAHRGLIRAEELRVNDVLFTREGTSRVTTLTREMYEDTVYNLAVGTPEELAKAGPESRTLYAGGLLMGDYTQQTELDAKHARPAELQASIPQRWVTDYLNDTGALKRGAR